MKKLKLIAYILLGLLLATFLYLKLTNRTFTDLGLTALAWAKNISGKGVDVDELEAGEMDLVDHGPWSELLGLYVSPEGVVNYQGFIGADAAMQDYLDDLSVHPPGTNWTEKDKLAYWINAYNAFTVKLIVDHYPVKSIKEIKSGSGLIDSPWDIKFFQIGGVDFDLSTIEHEILRKDFKEPRIHFAINCASISCPKLRNEAFVAVRLDEQLDDQTRDFLSNPVKNQISAEATKLSSIFSWFQSDFNRKMSLKTYIKQFHPSLNESNSISYLDYDWNLNE